MPLPDGERLFIGDGGLETTMIFREGFELPWFASFTLLGEPAGARRCAATTASSSRSPGARDGLHARHADLAGEQRLGRAARLHDRPRSTTSTATRSTLLRRSGPGGSGGVPVVVSGRIGPRGDGYQPGRADGAGEAEAYHAAQVRRLRRRRGRPGHRLTMNYAEEAIGIARAAGAAGLPVSISFTVETDGRLPPGSRWRGHRAGRRRDRRRPAYYMVNCAHPTHFADVLDAGGAWRDRIRGIRANASSKSHAELDEAEELDAGDPDELGRRIPRRCATALPTPPRRRRLLRHRSPPHRRDLRRLAGLSACS